jgi:hypothetical protein
MGVPLGDAYIVGFTLWIVWQHPVHVFHSLSLMEIRASMVFIIHMMQDHCFVPVILVGLQKIIT